MTNYRRAKAPGAAYFFTVNLARRDTTLLVDHIATLRQAIGYVRHRHPFLRHRRHGHPAGTPPRRVDAASRRHRLFPALATWFSRNIPLGEHRRASRIAKGELGIWQRRYWEHLIRDDADLQRHVDYIHFNPVKHGHVGRAADWPHSTFHRFVADGRLPADWSVAGDPGVDAGERK